jgi:hypothetical protein
MDQILYKYDLNLTTWIYLSSLLTIAIYFKFSRLWSLRNLDLLLLIAFAPGLVLVSPPKPGEAPLPAEVVLGGHIWLFSIGLLFLIRMLVDPMMVRRPLLEPNLSAGGLVFIACSLLVFLMVNVLTKELNPEDLDGPRQLRAWLSRTEAPADESWLVKRGPGYPIIHTLPSIMMRPAFPRDEKLSAQASQYEADKATVRTMAILSHLAVVFGMVLIGMKHFDNVRTGIAAATLYLLLPYTAEMTGQVGHVLPAALTVWAILCYRRPLVSGMLLGLATGAVYYPVFLLPLWIGFYWKRGLLRFGIGFATMLAGLVASLAFVSSDWNSFVALVKPMLGWTSLSSEGLDGFWNTSPALAPYRIPVFAACAVMSLSFAIWPAQKNLGTLLSCSAAVMLGTQFWQAQGGGLYMGWYLPLLLLTVFRPNLEDRIAISTLGDGWFTKRRLQLRVRAAAFF